MKRFIIISIFVIVFLPATHAQPFIAGTDGVFFVPDFCSATLFSERSVYRGLHVKLNLVTNEVRFIKENSDEIEMTVSFRIRKIVFGDCGTNKGPVVFQAGFPVVTSREDKDLLYQVLDSGKVTLLKRIRIIEGERLKDVYFGASKFHFEKVQTYYLYSPSIGMVKYEQTKEELLKVMDDKKAEVDNFISSNNIHLREEAELVKVIAYYNGLR